MLLIADFLRKLFFEHYLSILNAYILRASRQLLMLIVLVDTLYCTVR